MRKIETQNRILWALLCFVGVAALMGAQGDSPRDAKFDVIEAKMIYIVGNDGKKKIASFGNAGNDGGYLIVKNAKGDYGVSLGMHADGGGLVSIFSQSGKRMLTAGNK